MRNQHYTEEQKAFISQHCSSMTAAELTALFNETFHENRSINSITNHLYRHHPERKRSRAVNTSMHRYSPEENQWLREHHELYDTPGKLTKAFNKAFGTDLKVQAVHSHCVSALRLLYEEGHLIHQYSVEEEKWLRENFHHYETVKELCEVFNRLFDAIVKPRSLAAKCKQFGLAKHSHAYTEQEAIFIRENIDKML